MAKLKKRRKPNVQNRPGAVGKPKGVVLAHRKFTQDQIYSGLIAEGMPPSRAHIGSAVAMAESNGDNMAVGDGGTSFSVFQVHLPAHPQYKRSKLQGSLLYACKAAKEISNNGRDWTPWTTFRTGAYRKFMSRNPRNVTVPGSSPTTKGDGRVPSAGGATNLPAAQLQALNGMPGTQPVSFLGDAGKALGAPLGPFNPFDLGQLDPFHDIPGLGGIAPDVSPSGLTGGLLPQQIQDLFSLLTNLFTVDFWLKVGKVLLGLLAIYIGANSLLKLSIGKDITGGAKKAVGTATAVAATAAK